MTTHSVPKPVSQFSIDFRPTGVAAVHLGLDSCLELFDRQVPACTAVTRVSPVDYLIAFPRPGVSFDETLPGCQRAPVARLAASRYHNGPTFMQRHICQSTS